MVEADNPLQLLPPFILDIYKVLEHIDIMSTDIGYLFDLPVILTLLGSDVGVLGSLVESK
jgi:hypothetical protein